MNTFLIILFIVLVVIITLSIIAMSLYNKFSEAIIRIDEAESRIDTNLREKYDLLDRSISLFKNTIKLDDKAFKDLAKLKARKISNFELDRILANSYNEFITLYNANKELRDNDDVYKIYKQVELIDEELVTLRNYYNNNITMYNKMVKKIPTNIIAKIKKYKERTFYDLKDMTDDDHEDFKL